MGQLFNQIFFVPILNLLVVFYKVFLFIKLPGAFGLAIVALVVFVRLILHPFFKQQIETSRKMQDLKPHLDRISSKHKNDKKRLQEEQMKLYQQAGINPASGCLFMVVQIPVFIALYSTLQKFLLNSHSAKVIGEINKLLYSNSLHIQKIDPSFFGFNLALAPSKSGIWFYYVIPLVTAFLQYLQTKAMTPAVPPGVTDKKDEGKKGEKNKDSGDDFQKAMNTQMKFIFPLMIGWFSYTLPVGLSLYWNIFSLFSIMQYRKVKVQTLTLNQQLKK